MEIRSLTKSVLVVWFVADAVTFMTAASSATTAVCSSPSTSVISSVGSSNPPVSQPVPAATTYTFSAAFSVPSMSTGSATTGASTVSQLPASGSSTVSISCASATPVLAEGIGFRLPASTAIINPLNTASSANTIVSFANPLTSTPAFILQQPSTAVSAASGAAASVPVPTTAGASAFGSLVGSTGSGLSQPSVEVTKTQTTSFTVNALPVPLTATSNTLTTPSFNAESLKQLPVSSSQPTNTFLSTVASVNQPVSSESTGILFGGASSGFVFGSTVRQATATTASSSGRSVLPPYSSAALFQNPTSLTTTSGSVTTAAGHSFGSMFPNPATTSTPVSIQSTAPGFPFGSVFSNSTTTTTAAPTSSQSTSLSFMGSGSQLSTSALQLPGGVFGNNNNNSQSTASVAFGSAASQTTAFTFGGAKTNQAQPTDTQHPQFTPVFGSSVTDKQTRLPNTSVALGANSNQSAPNVFGATAPVAGGFGSNPAATLAGNNASQLGGFGSSAAASSGFGKSSLPSFGGFPQPSAVSTAAPNVAPFGQSAVNGFPSQTSTSTAPFVFSGSVTEKSVNASGNGFAFGAVPTPGAALSPPTNGMGFQTSTPGFKFGTSLELLFQFC